MKFAPLIPNPTPEKNKNKKTEQLELKKMIESRKKGAEKKEGGQIKRYSELYYAEIE